jgi:iron complex transport system substrate-binding protein
MNPNLEVVAKLQPDLVLLEGKQPKIRTFCERRNIPIIGVAINSLDTLREGIATISKALGCDEKGRALSGRISKELLEIKEKVADLPRPRVLLALGHRMGSLSGIYTSGGKGFLSEILELAGGEDIFKDMEKVYREISLEAMIKRAPDIILEMHPGEDLSPEDWEQIKKDWEGIRTIPAVRNGRIILVEDSFALVPGPRVPLMARKLAGVLHPDAGIKEE